jgi:hypothetical protein
MGKKGNACMVFVGKYERNRPLERLGIYGRVVLKLVLKK